MVCNECKKDVICELEAEMRCGYSLIDHSVIKVNLYKGINEGLKLAIAKIRKM